MADTFWGFKIRNVILWGPSARAALGTATSMPLFSERTLLSVDSSCSQKLVSHRTQIGTQGSLAPSGSAHSENCSVARLNVTFAFCLHVRLQGVSYPVQPHVPQCIF